jgi:hypothetical protein
MQWGGLGVAPFIFGFSLGRTQPSPTKALGKSLRVFRLGKAEHHGVAVIAAHGVRELRPG